jgi:phosphoribosylanthranilate isomerase
MKKIFEDVSDFLAESTTTIEEMRELNGSVVLAIRVKQQERDRSLAAQFKIGDKVWFDAKSRGVKHGEIVGFNSRTAKVRVSGSGKLGLMDNSRSSLSLPQTWTVAFCYLHKEA